MSEKKRTPCQLRNDFFEVLAKIPAKNFNDTSIPDICEKLDISYSTLYRTIKKSTGLSPRKSLEIMKFICFESLLSPNSQYNAKNARDALEYMNIQSHSHFIKKYKLIQGKTPEIARVEQLIEQNNRQSQMPPDQSQDDVF